MPAFSDFEKNGCAVLESFLTEDDVRDMILELDNIVNNIDFPEQRSIFKTGTDQVGDDYFINSGDKISYFFEKDAINENGELIVDKSRSLNKIGHALHWWNPVFKKVSFSNKIKDVLKQLHYKDPGLVQSMCIFKHPEIGGVVTPHQDSTFLYTTPLSTLGFWFPLVDVNTENGCLWYLPGSHRRPLYQRFIRNPSKDPLLMLKGDPSTQEDGYVPLLAKAGDCVIIHGSVLHKSGRNHSKHSRLVYTFHVVEKHDTVYSSENWLQPTERLPFPSVYKVSEI